jgi:hypothetical protein
VDWSIGIWVESSASRVNATSRSPRVERCDWHGEDPGRFLERDLVAHAATRMYSPKLPSRTRPTRSSTGVSAGLSYFDTSNPSSSASVR